MIKYRILTALLFSLCFSASAQRFVNSYNTIAEMVASQNLNTAATNINVLGYWAKNDGGGGAFVYDKTSIATTDGGTVFQPTFAVGRLLRTHDPMVIKARWFGVKGDFLDHALINVDQGPDESPYIDLAMAYASNHLNITVEFGPGDYMLTRTVYVPMATFVKGENPVTWFDNAGGRSSPVAGYMMNHNHTSTRFYPSQAMVGPMFAFTTTNSPLSVTPIRPTPIYLNPFPPTLGDGSEYLIYGFGSGLLNCQLDGSIITKTITTNRAVDGIFVDRAASILIDNVDVFHFKGWQIWNEGTWDLQIRNSRFTAHPDSYGCSLFKRMQDGKITDSYFAGQVNWFEDCGENLYMQNTFFNNWEKVERMSHWSNVVSTAGSPVFNYPGHNLRTPWPVIFTNAAPVGFDTNHTYWVSVIDDSNFKLCPLPGYVGQLDTNGYPTGARNGIGITNGSSGTWTLNGSPDCLVYNRQCIQGIWDANRIDQSVNHAVILSGPRCFENTFIGDAHLNMGIVFTGGAHITTTIPWYAAYVVKDGSSRNTMIPAQIGADLFGYSALHLSHSIGWVINDNCDYNVIGGGSRGNLATNYMIGAVGTAHTEIQFEQASGAAAPPIRQSLQKGLFFNGYSLLPPRITGDIGTVLVGTNDFTMAANVTYPPVGVYSGIFAISPVATSESGPYSFALQVRGDNLISIYKRDSLGSSVNTDSIGFYYERPDDSYNGRDMWFAVSRRGTNIVFTLDGRPQEASVTTGSGSMADPMGGTGITNYIQLGLASTSLPLNGRLNDFMMFNFAMNSDQMSDIKNVPIATRWKDGSPYTNQTSGQLVVGMEYEIVHYNPSDDFSNCGATNIQNTIFTATARVPTAWASGSSLRHRGLIYWPNVELGYGRTFPEKTTNSAAWSAFNGVYHLIDVDTPSEFDLITPIDVPQPLQTGVRYERSTTPLIIPRITTDLSSVTIGTNDFTVGIRATYTTNAIATGFIAISNNSDYESGTNSFYYTLRSDRILEVTKRSTTGASTGTDSSSQYYVPNELRAGRDIWMVATRQGSNVVAYADGVLLTPYIAVNQAGFADAFAPGTNYLHWGILSVSSTLDRNIRDGFMANFAMSSNQVASVRTNAFPSRYLFGSNTSLTSGSLEAGAVYRILSYNSPDDFANVGAASNADNVEFVATSRTPTAWGAASVLRKLGITVWPDFGVGVGNEFHDFAGSTYKTIGFTTGIHHIIPKKTGSIRFRTSVNGNQQLLVLGSVAPGLAIPTNARITDWTIISDGSGSATTSVDLGNASAGAQIASAVTIGTGFNDVTAFVSRYSTTGNLFVKANGSSVLDHNITYVIIE